MKGPAPKPAALRRLEGNPSKRPIPQGPEPEPAVPDCPEHLAPEAKAEWDRITTELMLLGLVTRPDRAALAAYCQAWARWVEAERQLEEYGLVVKAPSGYPVQSPYWSMARAAAEQMRKFLVEFGMTPSSRTRMGAPPAKKEPEANPFAGLKLA